MQLTHKSRKHHKHHKKHQKKVDQKALEQEKKDAEAINAKAQEGLKLLEN